MAIFGIIAFLFFAFLMLLAGAVVIEFFYRILVFMGVLKADVKADKVEEVYIPGENENGGGI